jgi:anthranilate phosphoribosyltransferase
MGVFNAELVGIQTRVLQSLGMTHAMAVFGRDGLDEISLEGPTLIGELKNGLVSEYEIHPRDFGLSTAPTSSFQVANAEESKQIVLRVLSGEAGPASDIVCLNAGATLYVADLAPDIATGITMAKAAIANGTARSTLDQFIAATQLKS